MKKALLAFSVLLGLVVFALPGYAAIYGTTVDPADYKNKNVSVSGGIYATGEWGSSGASLEWNIENLGTGWVEYKYKWTTSKKNLSHLILEISENAKLSEFDFSGSALKPDIKDPQFYNSESNGNSNPGMPGTIYGFKFSSSGKTEISFTFTSKHLPMWGNFYAKGGQVYAYNTGFTRSLVAGESEGTFIAVPDTLLAAPPAHAPIPGAVWLLGPGLVSLVAFRKRITR